MLGLTPSIAAEVDHHKLERRRTMCACAIIALLWLMQWMVFRQRVEHEIAWAYPRGYDQLTYLSRAYGTYEKMQTEGIAKGLRHSLQEPIPTGSLLSLQAALLFLITGPSRLAALSVNFLYFLSLQAAMVVALQWLSRRWSVAFLGLALLLSVHQISEVVGSITDFRIEFAAFCLQGIAACLVMRSGLFYSRAWSIVAGVSIGMLITLRHYASVHLSVIFAIISTSLLADYFVRRQNPAVAERRLRQIMNLTWAGLMVAAIALPALLLNRDAIYAYYFQEYFNTAEAGIRNAEFGIGSRLDFFTYYPHTVYLHAGERMLWTAGLVCLTAVVMRLLRDRAAAWHDPYIRYGEALFIVGVCFAAPLCTLIAFGAPSPIAAVVCLGPLVLFAPVVLAESLRGSKPDSRSRMETALRGMAIVCLLYGIYNYTNAMNRRGSLVACRQDVEQVAQTYECIGRFCRRYGLQNPAMFSDRISEYSIPSVLTVLEYERDGTWCHPSAAFGRILAADPKSVMNAVSTCDIVVVTSKPTIHDAGYAYPYDKSIRDIMPTLMSYCRHELLEIGRFHPYNGETIVYARPRAGVKGISGGWIPAEGLTLQVDGKVLKALPVIRLEGLGDTSLLNGSPAVTAELSTERGEKYELRATMQIDAGQYQIVIEADDLATLPDDDVEIRLHFKSYFVPADHPAIKNGDPRQLVVREPSKVALLQSSDAKIR